MRDFCCGLDFGGGLDPEGEGSWGGPMCLSPKWQKFRNEITLYVKFGINTQEQGWQEYKKAEALPHAVNYLSVPPRTA